MLRQQLEFQKQLATTEWISEANASIFTEMKKLQSLITKMENKNFSENENENEKLFWEQKFSPFSEKFFLENSAQNGLKMGERTTVFFSGSVHFSKIYSESYRYPPLQKTKKRDKGRVSVAKGRRMKKEKKLKGMN